MTIGGVPQTLLPDDKFEATGNSAYNYQNNGSTFGARGGAIYVAKSTSLIVAGAFTSNLTNAKYLQDATAGTNSGLYSRGGAICTENAFGRLTVRGGPRRDLISNQTVFSYNTAGSGGAIFVDGNPDPMVSPIVGGSDVTPITRDYGYGIKFLNNTAVATGGAIHTERNCSVYGGGGVEPSTKALIGYGGSFPVVFENNTAGYNGGAININIPNQNPLIPSYQRTVQLARIEFRTNTVGYGVADVNKTSIRGGGAVYSLNGDINVCKGVMFLANKVLNGSGGAILMANPTTSAARYYVNDIDNVVVDQTSGLVSSFLSNDDVFTYQNTNTFPPDARMMTRFLDNEVNVDADILGQFSGSGTTQIGFGTIGTGNALQSTTFLDANNGFAVGQYGTIIKITGGGSNWAYKNYSTPYRLKSVYFANASNGVIVGDRGLIIKSADGGNTWSLVRQPNDSWSLNAVTFSGAMVGYAVGGQGTILKTTDGGATWFNPTLSQVTSSSLNSVYFTGVNNGVIVGDRGTILVTTNGGVNWDVKNANTFSNLASVYFTDTQTGYTTGSFGQIFKTVNAGNTWTKIFEDATKNFTSIFFTALNNGYVVGDVGTGLKTGDAGATWTAMTTNTIYGLKSIFAPTSVNAFAVGDFGQIIKSTDAGTTWTTVIPADISNVDIKRYHPGAGLRENGIGLGGAIYVLDSISLDRSNRTDRIIFNRVRIQNNKAFTGAAVYSDNWNLKLLFNRSLITGNTATSQIGMPQNVITGPVLKNTAGDIIANVSSSDLASTILYGEVVGPMPVDSAYNDKFASYAANSIYNNHARFLVRLPDAPNTKGVLAGRFAGFGGTDTLRVNYWGKTEANVTMSVTNTFTQAALEETFFVETEFNPGNLTYMKFMYPATTNLTEQGPFESPLYYSYNPIPFTNGANENTADVKSIPAKVLMAGLIYDIHDKGTDIKTSDYSKRRMSPIEDFSVGIPPVIRRYNTPGLPSNGKYVKRWIRNPFIAEQKDSQGKLVYPNIAKMQDEFRPDKDGNYYHPIGYPLYLETSVNYDGLAERSNNDTRLLNESVFFVMNETTSDYIRLNMRQVDENAPYREVFRGRAELVPDQTNRPDTKIRRSNEGLMNLGTGFTLLTAIANHAWEEDGTALTGRKYSGQYDANTKLLGNLPVLFSNRPGMPVTNAGQQTYFAGDRYTALPVNVGDQVRIVSRTALWREGVIPAYNDGITFKIVGSTLPPIWTGNIVTTSTDTLYKLVGSEYPWEKGVQKTKAITEFLNKIFITEGREYPSDPGTYTGLTVDDGQGVDSILTVTASDTNKFWDPLSFHQGGKYPQLHYTWDVTPWTGLSYWLMVDTIAANDNQHQNPRDEAQGYLMFRGHPINPYVVPGGEDVNVHVYNFPSAVSMIDSLKSIGVAQNIIDSYMNLFRPYLNAGSYDAVNARYLQQDTINYGTNQRLDYTFKIFVVNQPPVFRDSVLTDSASQANTDTLFRRINLAGDKVPYVLYQPSVYICGMTPQDPLVSYNTKKMKANLTDKLRFEADFNTNAELEDRQALAAGWDFRYGKTAYGFMSINIRNNGVNDKGGDTTVIDSTYYDRDLNGVNDTALVRQTRPYWMSNKYLYFYNKEGGANQDQFGVDFTTYGRLNIRIDSVEAWKILKPTTQWNGYLNTDTMFTVICNDGHGGLTPLSMPVYINVEPIILTSSLLNAKEDIDYNPELLDSSKMIKIYDPNTDQEHRFELVYSDYPQDQIQRDPCYSEAGIYDLRKLKTTPNWLKVNPISGILYGTPRVHDAPRNEKVTVICWDIINGERQLSAVKVLDLRVDSSNHRPHITAAPKVRCIDKGSAYTDTLIVSDYDLQRDTTGGNPSETLTIAVYDKNFTPLAPNFTVEPNLISGPRQKDSVKVLIKSNSFDLPVDADGKVTLIVIVTDASGASDTTIFRLKYSDPTDFICPLLIENTWPGNTPGDQQSAWQILEFGTAPKDATTGDGLDGEAVGTLDYKFCEYELPPIPPNDVFDARWTISNTQGTTRDIFPRAKAGVQDTREYHGIFQAGGIVSNTSIYYPVSISWDGNDIPDKTDNTKNPTKSSWYIRDAGTKANVFNYNMRTGDGTPGPTGADCMIKKSGSKYRVEIHNTAIDKFVILHDWASDNPETPVSIENGIAALTPNPESTSANITIGIKNSGNIRLEVIDALGNVVALLADGEYPAGLHNVIWNTVGINGTPLANGAYTLRLSNGVVTSTMNLVIVR
jgi:predicted outer membrane repeat protein